jgi:AcrR family transcriptional regulator
MEINLLHRKYRLVITAIDVIDELSILGLSTREIAKREGVSEATLFRHFKNKNELLIAVLDYFSQFDDDIFETTVMKQLEPREAITFLVGSYAEYYENYPAIISVLQIFDVIKSEPELAEKVKMILTKRTEFLSQMMTKAQKAGVISPTADSQMLVDILFGFCLELCYKWKLAGKNFSLKEQALATLKLFFDAFA